MESYPPTFAELRASFLATRPGYAFGTADSGAFCPLEPVGYRDICGQLITTGNLVGRKDIRGHIITEGQRDSCHDHGERYNEWICYIEKMVVSLATEACISLPKKVQQSIDPYRRLFVAEEFYREICRNPAITMPARIQRERARELEILRIKDNKEHIERQKKISIERAAKEEEDRKEKISRFEQDLALAKVWASTTRIAERDTVASTISKRENDALVESYRTSNICKEKISGLASRASITNQEADAVLAHIYNSKGYTKDTLLALKVINRYATENSIRVEDAVTVLREYSL